MSSLFQTSESQTERKPATTPEQDKMRATATPSQSAAEKAVVAEIDRRREEERRRAEEKGSALDNFIDFHRQLQHHREGVARAARQITDTPIPDSVLEKSMRVMNQRMDQEKLNLSPEDLKTVKEFERAVLSGDLKKLRELGKSAPKASVIETISRDFHQISMDVDWRSGYMAVYSEYNNSNPMLSLFPISPDSNRSPAANLIYNSEREFEKSEPGVAFFQSQGNGLGAGIHYLDDPNVAAREMALLANARLSGLSRR